MNKHVFFCIIPMKNKTSLLASVTHGALTYTSSENTVISVNIAKQLRRTVPVYEAVSVTHIEPFHCALNQSGWNDR